MDNVVPPTGGPLLEASTGSAGLLLPSRTLTHVRSAPSATAEQEKPDTAQRASGDSTTSGQINRGIIPLKAENRISRQEERVQSLLPPWVNGNDHRVQHEHLLAIFRL